MSLRFYLQALCRWQISKVVYKYEISGFVSHHTRNSRTMPYDAKMSKTQQEPLMRLESRGWWAGGATMANLPFSISAVFNKAFSHQPPLLLARGAARGPPDAYRQMSLVEQNTLCLTSQAATGLWRKLKGCLPCKDQGFWVDLPHALPVQSSGHSRELVSM